MPNVIMFGDSNSTTAFLSSASELHCEKSKNFLPGMSLNNQSSGSLLWVDQTVKMVPTPSYNGILPGSGDIPMFMLGTNDANVYGNASGPREHGFVPNVRGGLVWMGCPDKLIPMINGSPNTNVARTGGWGQSPHSSIGICTPYAGEFIDAYVYGPAVYIFGLNYANADADVTIDGVYKGTVSQRGSTVQPYLAPRVGAIGGAVPYGYGAWRILTGKGPGQQSLMRLSVTTNGPTFFCDAIISADQSWRPRVVCGDIIYQIPRTYSGGNSHANINTLNGRIYDVLSELSIDGMINFQLATLNSSLHPALYHNVGSPLPDGVHIDKEGHRVAHRCFVDAALR